VPLWAGRWAWWWRTRTTTRTYLSAPISGAGALRDLSVMVIVIPFASCFRIHLLLQRTRFSVLIAATTQSSFNEASEIISPTCQNPWPKFWRSPRSDLLALLAGVITKGTLAYDRDNSPVGHQVAEAPPRAAQTRGLESRRVPLTSPVVGRLHGVVARGRA
jgi:hypothetical protein